MLMLRVLVGLAWADRRIDQSERDFIASAARSLGLDEESLATIEAMLDKPQDKEDMELLLRDFLHGTLTRPERSKLIELMEGLVRADGEVSETERELIEQITRIRQLAAPFGRLRQAMTKNGAEHQKGPKSRGSGS